MIRMPRFKSRSLFERTGWILSAVVLLSACGSTSTESVTSPSAPKCSVALTEPASAVAAGGGVGAVTVSTQPECTWTATADATWITEVAPAQGQGGGEVTFRVQPNPSSTLRQSAIAVNGQRAVIRQDASPCALTVGVSDNSYPAAGGQGVITVAAPAGCPWSATSEVSWIAVSVANGTGSANFGFTVSANPGTARTGTITAGGSTITIDQASGAPAPCDITLQPTSTSMPVGGGAGTVAVTTNAGCAWTATSQVPWITVTPPASRTGSHSLGFNVASNASPMGRVGTLNIGNATFTVNQAGSQSCTFTINPTTEAVGAAGASGINVSVATTAGCAWTATSNASWLTITAGSSGNGNGTVTLSAAANSGGARTGTATIAGRTFTVNQAAAACTPSINPTSQSVGAAGATGLSIAVSAGPACAWMAVSNASWLTIVSGASGTGNGTVSYNVASNGGAARSGTMTVAGLTFTVNQAAAPACTYTIDPTSATVGDDGATGLMVAVTAATGCAWTASSNAGWLQITAGSSGTGNGNVTYNVADFGGSSRTGTLTIAGRTFTVTQERCSATLNPTSQSVPVLGGSFSVSVTIQLGCEWQAVESLNWVTVTGGGSGTGSGSVSYSVSPNVGGARSGNLSIAGRTLTINQAGVTK
jgi:hypothetical protein